MAVREMTADVPAYYTADFDSGHYVPDFSHLTLPLLPQPLAMQAAAFAHAHAQMQSAGVPMVLDGMVPYMPVGTPADTGDVFKLDQIKLAAALTAINNHAMSVPMLLPVFDGAMPPVPSTTTVLAAPVGVKRPGSDLSNPSKRRKKDVDRLVYVCEWEGCDYVCSQPGKLRIHNQIHSGKRPFACNYPGCDYACGRADKLKQHYLRHTKVKPFACDYPGCNYACNRTDSLKGHKRNKHPDFPHCT